MEAQKIATDKFTHLGSEMKQTQYICGSPSLWLKKKKRL